MTTWATFSYFNFYCHTIVVREFVVPFWMRCSPIWRSLSFFSFSFFFFGLLLLLFHKIHSISTYVHKKFKSHIAQFFIFMAYNTDGWRFLSTSLGDFLNENDRIGNKSFTFSFLWWCQKKANVTNLLFANTNRNTCSPINIKEKKNVYFSGKMENLLVIFLLD